MKIDRLDNKTVVVTGAASGIGLATVRALVARGARAAICDLDDGRLSALASELEAQGLLLTSQVVDVSSRDSVVRFADAVHDKVDAVDIVVNNAGIAVAGSFVDVPLDEWDRVVGINLCGVAYGCHAFLPRMIAAKRGGHIVNVASMAGYSAGPGMASYHASKFGVIGLSESLRLEVAEHDIGVTAVCPGLIKTSIAERAKTFGELSDQKVRQRFISLFEQRGRHPDVVAKAIISAISRDISVAPVTAESHAMYWLKRVSPYAVEQIAKGLARRAR